MTDTPATIGIDLVHLQYRRLESELMFGNEDQKARVFAFFDNHSRLYEIAPQVVTLEDIDLFGMPEKYPSQRSCNHESFKGHEIDKLKSDQRKIDQCRRNEREKRKRDRDSLKWNFGKVRRQSIRFASLPAFS